MTVRDAKGVEVDSEKLSDLMLRHAARYWLRHGKFNLIQAKITVRELASNKVHRDRLLKEMDKQHALWVGRRANRHDKDFDDE